MSDEFPTPVAVSSIPPAPAAEPPISAEPPPAPVEPPPTEPKHDDDVPLPKGVQRRIDRAVRQKYEAEARARVAEEELARVRQTPPPTAQRSPTAEAAPTIDKFDNIEDYVTAKAEWVAREQIRQAITQTEQSRRQQSAERETQQLQLSWQQRVTEAQAKLPDFEEVLGASEAPMSQVMGRAILESDVGPQIAYWLAQNPTEATKISQMPPMRAVAALGRLEEKLTAAPPVPPPVSKAPPPIEPVGSRAAVSKDPDKMSTAEWLAWRQKQLKSR